MWELFRGPHLPPVWEPHVCERKKLWFIMHFRTLGTFLVFTKKITLWVVLWLEEVGMDDPHSPREEFPLYPVFFDFFTE